MPNCSVFCCKNRSATSSLQNNGVTFHMFPKDPNLRDAWKKFCNNKITWSPTRNSVICSKHFKTSDFQVLANNRRKLVEGTKPTLTPHCVCPSHQQSFTRADDGHNAISATLTIPDSLNTCIKGLLGPIEEKSLIHQKSRGKLLYAPKEVILLCRICEKEIRRRLSDDNKPTRSCTTHEIVAHALKKFIGKDFSPSISYHSHENDFTNHNLELARLLMAKYTGTRISFLMKKENPQKCIRHIYRKLIHFKNQ